MNAGLLRHLYPDFNIPYLFKTHKTDNPQSLFITPVAKSFNDVWIQNDSIIGDLVFNYHPSLNTLCPSLFRIA